MATTKEPTVTTAATEPAAPREGSSEQPASATRFTTQGPIPPVAPLSDARVPTASERAFQDTGNVQGYKDASGGRLALDNPTWDPNAEVFGSKDKGGWVEATAARNAPGTKSDAPTADGGTTRVDKRMITGTTIDPSKRNANLESGHVNDEQLHAITTDQVAQINPLGPAPRNILKHALHQSWHHAKHALLAPGDNQPARQMLMAKLWEFRQWHHIEILKRTQAEVGREGLEEWKEAGSTTLTSDIDVNLKGKETERAVAVFNKLFKADGWQKEAGVVYDVNVYALDFMHKDTFKGLADNKGTIEAHKFTAGDTATRVSAKEGARDGSAGGGIGTKNPMLEQRMVQADADLQRVWSLVKMRFYMTGNEWNEYVQSAGISSATLAQVTLRYDQYMSDLQDKMHEAAQLVVVADAKTKTGSAVIEAHAQAIGKQAKLDPENVKMEASNRLYEKRLEQMAELRTKVQQQIALRKQWLDSGKGKDAEALDAAIDGNLAILRDLISECSMFANEAYLTDGGVNHAVVGLQSKVGIAQTKSESMDAFNENAADSLKEIARHSGSLGEAAYKAGKYLWRMADAAQNMGVKDADVAALFKAGFHLANKIKGSDDATQAELEQKAGAFLVQTVGDRVATPDLLMAFVRTLAARVAKSQAGDLTAHGQDRAAPVNASPA